MAGGYQPLRSWGTPLFPCTRGVCRAGRDRDPGGSGEGRAGAATCGRQWLLGLSATLASAARPCAPQIVM